MPTEDIYNYLSSNLNLVEKSSKENSEAIASNAAAIVEAENELNLATEKTEEAR
jgi:hypothetical protein